MPYKIAGEIIEERAEGLIAEIFEIEKGMIDDIIDSSYNFEFERKHVKNIREKASILIELVDNETSITYEHPFRPKFEVFGGYKIAQKKQKIVKAKFDTAKVYNLYFRFKNQRIDVLDATAVMYRPKKK
jgi:hypothetical protein